MNPTGIHIPKRVTSGYLKQIAIPIKWDKNHVSGCNGKPCKCIEIGLETELKEWTVK